MESVLAWGGLLQALGGEGGRLRPLRLSLNGFVVVLVDACALFTPLQ